MRKKRDLVTYQTAIDILITPFPDADTDIWGLALKFLYESSRDGGCEMLGLRRGASLPTRIDPDQIAASRIKVFARQSREHDQDEADLEPRVHGNDFAERIYSNLRWRREEVEALAPQFGSWIKSQSTLSIAEAWSHVSLSGNALRPLTPELQQAHDEAQQIAKNKLGWRFKIINVGKDDRQFTATEIVPWGKHLGEDLPSGPWIGFWDGLLHKIIRGAQIEFVGPDPNWRVEDAEHIRADPPQTPAGAPDLPLHTARKRGRRPFVRERVKTAMLRDLHCGKTTAQRLHDDGEEVLATTYKASRETCRLARDAVLSEFQSK